MMMRSIGVMVGIVLSILAGATAQAELKLVVDFEGLSGNPDGQPCNGVLGGTLDTESEGTGNSSLRTQDGSNTMSVIGHSSGNLARAIGFGGTDNPIDNTETGIGFFRFMVASGNIRPHMGLVTDTDGNPVNSTNTQDPQTVPAGFRLVANGAGFDVVTVDGATVLETGLSSGQWYNVWIVADNSADVFDLYMSEAEGPAGAATLPGAADLIERAIPFAVATTDPLNGMIFANPTGTGQASRIYVDEIYWDGDQGLSAPTTAKNPSPGPAETDVPTDVILAWTGAPSAVKHDVYLGTSLADVEAASIDNPLGVLASEGQADSTYQPIEPLEFGTTYYWRIDEVNAPPDGAVFTGAVWSFTVEPFGYPIENVVASASSSSLDMGPEKTVDGSGLNDADEHSKEDGTMWLSALGAAEPTWIQYEFDRAYKLDEMWVWNFNQGIEPYVGFGVKDAMIEYSADGETWTTLEGVPEFTRAPGADGYMYDTVVDFGGVSARFVKLTCTDNWGILSQYGLSEVRFSHVPVQARGPEPADGATDLELDVTLNWRPGREAVSHEVYFSDDAEAVAAGTAVPTTLDEHRFDATSLNFGTVYSWKVNEIGEAASYPGEVWSFTTKEYAVVDDFESYTDDIDAGTTIWQTWLDGLTNDTGSTVGYWEAPFAEQTIVHGGKQSMPFDYNNVNSPYYSEIERSWDSPQDWTINGADTLSLYVRGNPAGFVETPPDTITMSAGGYDIWGTEDEFTYAFKSLNGNGSITVRVDSLVNSDPWAKAGVMIRNGLGTDVKNAMAYVTPDGRVGWQYRELPVGDSVSTRSEPGVAPLPHWVRLTRTGNLIKAEHSSDGTTWEPMVEEANPAEPSSIEITMTGTVLVGLAVTSHTTTATTTAEFFGASTEVPGPWQVAQIGTDLVFNDRADLYVALQDKSNRLAVVKHPDPGAVLQDAWQQWRISLADFTNVNLAAITKLYIGVGDRDNPQAGGAGMLYIDDIGFGHPAPGDGAAE